jgi:hypothetical protein
MAGAQPLPLGEGSVGVVTLPKCDVQTVTAITVVGELISRAAGVIPVAGGDDDGAGDEDGDRERHDWSRVVGQAGGVPVVQASSPEVVWLKAMVRM